MFTDPLLNAEYHLHEAEQAVKAATTHTERALAMKKRAQAINRLESAKYVADPEAYRLREEARRDNAAYQAHINS